MNQMKTIINKYTLIICGIVASLTACTEDYQPKPKGFFRIDLEDKNYLRYENTECPFVFEYPAYTTIQPSPKDPCWMNLYSKKYNATLHLTYRNVSKNMEQVIGESIRLTYEHASKADGIDEQFFSIDSSNVFALMFDISGDAASDLQFIATDSADHFLRGALYFNVSPNEDSLAPLHNYFKEDIVHLIETIKWKE